MRRFLLPSDLDESAIAAGVDPGLHPVFGPEETVAATYLDTFDWRLHRAGLALVEERGRHRQLVLLQEQREPVVVPVAETPTTAGSLPQGFLASSLGPLMGVRSLVTVGTLRIVRRDGRLEDGNGNLAARLRLETISRAASGAGTPRDEIKTLGTSDPAALGRVLDIDGVGPCPPHDLEISADEVGRRPGDYSSKIEISLDPGQTAGSAAVTILRHLLTTLEANVDGTIDDLDTEFLHDLRVACRRSRSALGQLKGTLRRDITAPFNAEFKWLGGVTGPLRDLDVFLLEMPTYRTMLPAHAAAYLEPLEALIVRSRIRAHRSVARALRSARFSTLTAGWRAALETAEITAGGDADRAISSVAEQRITKAFRRILERGRVLTADPPASALHRLRIDAKKLRYLLEFFRTLYPQAAIDHRIRELKRLQDILGGFNDMVVQRDRLAGFADELHADRSVPAGCILSLGRLAGTLERRQEDFRSAFHDAFVEFSGKPVRAAYQRLFARKEAG